MSNSTEQERELLMQVRYATWRMAMWFAGFGTYIQIDQGVLDGKYDPSKRPKNQEGYIDDEPNN